LNYTSMSNYLICWDCRVENETVTYSEKDGRFCPKCRDRFYNNYNLVCRYCDKRYINITERNGKKWFNDFCSKCYDELMERFKESYEW